MEPRCMERIATPGSIRGCPREAGRLPTLRPPGWDLHRGVKKGKPLTPRVPNPKRRNEGKRQRAEAQPLLFLQAGTQNLTDSAQEGGGQANVFPRSVARPQAPWADSVNCWAGA